MKTKTTVICTLQYEAWHYWKNAPENYAYLMNSHRHIFHVRAVIPVNDMDREIEFIDVKEELQVFCNDRFGNSREKPLTLSCENMAFGIAEHLSEKYLSPHIRVEVMEDGENGAEVTMEIS